MSHTSTVTMRDGTKHTSAPHSRDAGIGMRVILSCGKILSFKLASGSIIILPCDQIRRIDTKETK